MDDAALVVAAREGDRDAFAAIYDRYADRIHDFCCSVLRDRAEAADAMQDTFLAAARKLGQLREPSKLRAWLFAIARHESLRRAKARSRAVPTDDFPDLAASGASPEDEVRRSDLSDVVWAAAAGLSERDRALLDLHLRQGLDGQELADTIGVTAGHAYVLMNRLRTQVERSLGALLIARLGRDDCEDLAAILKDWDGTFSVLIRKRVARHVDGCEVCGERKRTLVSPLSMLAAVPMIPAASSLRERVLSRVQLTSATSPVGDSADSGGDAGGVARRRLGRGDGWRADGFPPAMVPSLVLRRLVVAAVAAVLALGVGGGAFLALRDTAGKGLDVAAGAPATTAPDGDTTVTTSEAATSTTRPPRTTTTTVAEPTTATTATTASGVVSPPAYAPPTDPPATSPPATTAPTTTPPTTTAPATTTTTTVVVDEPPIVEITNVTNTTIYQTTGGCSPTYAYFEAVVTDDRAVDHVVISWTSDSGDGSGAMVADDATWYGSVGPFDDVFGAQPDDVQVTVTGYDSAGQSSGAYYTITLEYEIC